MHPIEIYLKKFANFGLKEKLLKEEIIKIIKEETSIDLKEKDLDIRDGIIRININGPAKTEIFIRRKKIQEQLEKNFEVL